MQENPANRAEDRPSNDPKDEWLRLAPDELLRNRTNLKGMSNTDALKALQYGTLATSDSYDEIAHRIAAATPCGGAVPLQTIRKMIWQRAQDSAGARFRRLDRIHDGLHHRTLDLDLADGSVRYEVRSDTIDFFTPAQQQFGRPMEDRWRFGRAHPPEILLRDAIERDAARCLSQEYTVKIPGAAWVPLTLLVDEGRFRRRQDWEDRLSTEVGPGVLSFSSPIDGDLQRTPMLKAPKQV